MFKTNRLLVLPYSLYKEMPFRHAEETDSFREKKYFNKKNFLSQKCTLEKKEGMLLLNLYFRAIQLLFCFSCM